MSGAKRIVLIPAFNEARHLHQVLAGVRESARDFEIVVVDDGSTDDTAAVASDAGARVLRHPVNLGYGAAIQTGYKYALRTGAGLVVQLDADGQHDPADIPALTAPIERDELDLVIGSRFVEPTRYRMGRLREAGRRLFRGLARALGLDVTDPTSGFQALGPRALRLYVQDFFPSDYPDIDVLVAADRAGVRIGERPVSMGPGLRESTLHAGLAPLYYVYKMLLSLWVMSRPARAHRGDGEEDR